MNPTVHHASRVRIVLMMILMIGVAALFWNLAASGYLAVTEFRRSLRIFNAVPPEIRTWGGYFFAGFMLATAVSLARFLVDTRLVLIDDESIEVRYPLWSKKAYWDDFTAVKPILGHFRLKFGTSPKTVEPPSPIFGAKGKAIMIDVLGRVLKPDGQSQGSFTGPMSVAARPATYTWSAAVPAARF